MRDQKKAREIPISFDDPATEGESGPDTQRLDELSTDSDSDERAIDVRSTDPDDPPAAEPGPADELAQLKSQIEALSTERTSLYDQLLRRQAEFENYRKRVERERSQTYQRGRDDVLVQFLPVVDNFERALESLERSEGDAEALRHGVELIHRQFKDALFKFGLEPVESVGHTFDPHVHEAVTTEPTDKHKENTVIEEFQRGYKIGDRLLRPAKVKVASSPEK